MCEKEPKRRSCTTCPQYDGATCQATGFELGDKETVLASENRRGFICVDTGEGTPHNTFVMTTRIVDSEPDAKSVDYPKDNPNTDWPQYNGLECRATDAWTGGRDSTTIVADSADLKEVTVSPPMPEHEVSIEFSLDEGTKTQISNSPGPVRLTFQYEEEPKSATADCISDMLHKGEGGPFTNVFTGAKMPDGIIHMVDCNPAHAQFQYRPESLPKYAGSPSSECPSRREGPPQKGKIDDHNALRMGILRHPEATCLNCNKSHREGLRLVCDRWGLQNIQMPQRTCEKWALGLPKVRAEVQQIRYAEGSGLQYVENPLPLFTRDPNGYWEPIKPRSCTNCKGYNDPICMKMATHIGTRDEIWAKEKRDGFQCIAALPKEEREAVITSIGCNNRKELR